MKTLRKLRIEENFLNLIKGICEESRANIILNVEILNSFSLISEIREVPFPTTSIQYYTRDSCWCNKVRKEMKVIQMKRNKIVFFYRWWNYLCKTFCGIHKNLWELLSSINMHDIRLICKTISFNNSNKQPKTKNLKILQWYQKVLNSDKIWQKEWKTWTLKTTKHWWEKLTEIY